jgi:hypothetical protein
MKSMAMPCRRRVNRAYLGVSAAGRGPSPLTFIMVPPAVHDGVHETLALGSELPQAVSAPSIFMAALAYGGLTKRKHHSVKPPSGVIDEPVI